MSSGRVSIGVVGAGAVAQVAHLVALPTLSDAEVVAICDTDMVKAGALASRLGVNEVYEDVDDMFRHSRPDAVVICTPSHLHEVHVVAALAAGAHVLCERPLALTVSGVERIAEAQKKSGLVVLVGMNLRFRSDVQAAVSYCEGGELGDLTAIRGGWYIFRPIGPELGWRLSSERAGGGAMMDMGLPLIDLALWIAGHPKKVTVSAQLSPEPVGDAVEDSGCVLMRCDGNMSIFIDVSWRHVGDKERAWFELIGTRGSAKMSPLKVFKQLHGTPVNVTPSGAQSRLNIYNASYGAEWAHFLAAMRGESEVPSLDEQLLLHRVLEAIWQSAEESREIAL